MKFMKCLLSAAVSLALAVSAVPLCSSAVSVTFGDISQTEAYTAAQNRYDTIESASRYMRQCIRDRQETIVLSIPSSFDFYTAFDTIIRNSFAETYDGRDGDYIRTAVKSYSCKGGYDSGYFVLKFSMIYRTTSAQEKYVDTEVARILKNLDLSGKSDYEKIRAIYSYIVKNVSYDSSSDKLTRFTAYGALHDKKAVCQGYAHLFYRMCKDSGISCRMISGDAGGGHAWTIAAVNGIYYLLDPTWDIYTSGEANWHYFMKGTKDFDDYDKSTPHIADSDDESKSPYNINYNSAAFKKMYPLSQTAYNTSKPAVGYSIGDVDKDGAVDSSDASLILMAYSNLSTGNVSGLTNAGELASDANGDGIIDSVDASAVLSYYSHIQTGGKMTPKTFFAKY